MNKYLLLVLLFVLSMSALLAITTEQKLLDQETVTFLETTNFNDALQILETFSWRYERKKIINLSQVNDAIGIPIHNLTWRKSLELLALKKGLVIEESVGAVIVKNAEVSAGPSDMTKPKVQSMINTKQVRISSIAFTCDKNYLKSLGIDWSTLLSGNVNHQALSAGAGFSTASLVPDPVFSVGSPSTDFEAGNAGYTWDMPHSDLTLSVNTLINTIESNDLGTVIARPSIVVSSGKKGYIQVGDDVSVKTVDDAGNTTDKFYSTGVILDVTPTILVADDDTTEVVHLLVSVERSFATPGAVSTRITKNNAITDVILYNGEETAIAGLYSTDDKLVRSGIPFLKDLPWWVLGIRYLTGYSKTEKKESELVFIIKADIIDNAMTRMRLNK